MGRGTVERQVRGGESSLLRIATTPSIGLMMMTRSQPRALARTVAMACAMAGAIAALAVAPLGAQQLGPVDGSDLSPTDTGRVHAGMLAPDFTLESFAGPRVTLSQFRGKKSVVLAFYRGHW